MKFNLSGKTAFVSGSTSGIGKSVALRLALNGCNLVLVGRDIEKLETTSKKILELASVNIDLIQADFDTPVVLNNVVSAFITNSKRQIDILINCVRGPMPEAITTIKASDMITTLNRHLVSSHVLAQLFTKNMQKNGYGRIINIIDTIYKTPYPGLALSVVRAAEAAWIKALSVPLAKYGITVNAILPGPTDTPGLKQVINRLAENNGTTPQEILSEVIDETPIKRLATPEEIANIVIFIASEEASYLTGAAVNVDGGFSPSM